jgi:DNA polymerase III sliding clamp (beta) subunit (PCNA family)
MECIRDHWTAALELMRHATAPKSTTLPQLGDVVVQATQGIVRIEATNLDTELVVQFPGDGDIERMTAPIEGLLRATKAGRKQRGEPMEATSTPTGLRLAIAGRLFEVAAGFPLAERPVPRGTRDWSGAERRTWASEPLAAALAYCAPAMSKDETRSTYQAAHFGGDHVVTTDGHRMHVARDIESFQDGILVPPGAVEALRACLRATEASWAEARRADSLLQVSIEGVFLDAILTSKCADGDFPAWQQVCPSHRRAFEVDAQRWQDSLGAVRKLDNCVWVAVHKRECRVEIQKLFAEVLPLATTKNLPESRFAVHPGYLADASAGAHDCVRIEHGEPLDPIVVRPHSDHFAIVMPKRGD